MAHAFTIGPFAVKHENCTVLLRDNLVLKKLLNTPPYFTFVLFIPEGTDLEPVRTGYEGSTQPRCQLNELILSSLNPPIKRSEQRINPEAIKMSSAYTK